jgi:hypothetical protein
VASEINFQKKTLTKIRDAARIPGTCWVPDPTGRSAGCRDNFLAVVAPHSVILTINYVDC